MSSITKALLTLALMLSPLPACADMGVGNGGAPVAAAAYSILTTSGTTVVKGSPGVFYGASNLATSAQLNAVTCYDNASSASGNVVFYSILGLGGSYLPPRGIILTNGLTCSVTATLLGSGVAVYWV